MDSFQKVVQTYFSAITSRSFEYEGVVYRPQPLLVVSPGIFRGFSCPSGCGGCCKPFSLLYLPSEKFPYRLAEREVWVDGKMFTVFQDGEQTYTEPFCRNLIRDTGRCGIHGAHPFTCDFELLRFTHQHDRVLLNHRLFGRGWSYTRIDGEKGAMCSMLPGTQEDVVDAGRKLRRLKQWAEYFEISHCLDPVIHWVDTGPHIESLKLDPSATSIEEYV